jgi:hypothetical protein
VFGREQRKVPAHMPHMVDTQLVQEMQDRWTQGACVRVGPLCAHVRVHACLRAHLRAHLMARVLTSMYACMCCMASEWEATSRHRFRSGEDMQFSFSFYYYLMNRHKVRNVSVHSSCQGLLSINHNDGCSPYPVCVHAHER